MQLVRGRAHQRVDKSLPGQRARPPRQRKRKEHADHRRFRGGGKPAIDRADDAHDQQHYGNQATRRVDALAERHRRFWRRHARLVQQGPCDDEAHEQSGKHNSGNDAGDEQSRNRLISGGCIDDHDDRRRDQQPKRAGAGERADRHALVIAALEEFRQCNAADSGARGGRGAGHRGEYCAADDIHVQQAAGQFLQPGRKALEHVVRQFRAIEDFAHPDEHRQRGEIPGVRCRPHRRGEHLPRRRCHFRQHCGEAAHRQCQRDPHAGAEDCEQQQHQEKGELEHIHGSALLAQRDRIFGGAEARAAAAHDDEQLVDQRDGEDQRADAPSPPADRPAAPG